MLKAFIRSRLKAFEKDMHYDLGYAREILDADFGAFMRVVKFQSAFTYRKDVPTAVWHAVRLVGTLQEDCGPCSQLMVTMASRAGVAPEILRAVATGNDAVLPQDVRLGVQFARASLARSPEADTLREQILARWGRRALVSLAFGLIAARAFPTLKYALGYGRTCCQLEISGTPLVVRRTPDLSGATT